MDTAPILEVRGLVKTFPGVRALDGVSLALRRGEVHALVGENGAGKSTLIYILGGVHRPDGGAVLLDGRPVRFRSARDAAERGIRVVFQELSLAANLSAAENIFANRQPLWGPGLVDWGRLHGRTRRLLDRFGLAISPRVPVGLLSAAHQQVVEILKAMSSNPRVLILDEPTSSLTEVETARLMETIRRLKAEGTSFIYISHHLPEVFRIADRVTVLRDGRYVGTRRIAEVTESSLIRMMVGRELGDIYARRTTPVGPQRLGVEGASGDGFSDVSFSLGWGEIVGLAGLVGAGRTELARALFGAARLRRGRLMLDGRAIRTPSPRHAVAGGIGYLTEDRKAQGLFGGMSFRDNCIAPSLGRFAGVLGWMMDARRDRFAESLRRRFRIATPSLAQRVRNLSGGNQQKVLLAMWTGVRPKVLIVDEPTRGVDVGARSEIYALLRDLAAEGVAILMISSDLLEVLGLSDRVLVMREGRLVGEFNREQATEEGILACAAGLTQTPLSG